MIKIKTKLHQFSNDMFTAAIGGAYAMAFMDDVASRLASRVQMTTDGHRAYLEALEARSVAMLTMHSS